MTRVNTIDPSILSDQHLMAEYREIPMVMGSLKRTLASKKGLDHKRKTDSYNLNKGHVYSFYFRGKWLHERYQSLISELEKRGYNLDPERVADFDVFKECGLYLDWTASANDHLINIERIVTRISEKPAFYKLRGKPKQLEDWKNLYQEYAVNLF